MSDKFEIRCCENSACGLRYPIVQGHPFGERCPICLGTTLVAVTRDLATQEPPPSLDKPKFHLEVLLDNIRSAWNVGAIFRTADGFGVQKLYLCGITPTPANPSVGKTALGADQIIPWAYSRNALEIAREIKSNGHRLWALEQDERAVSVYSNSPASENPAVLILGNEVSGVDPALLDLCEKVFYIPMLGKKRSLNVEVAFGAAVSVFRNNTQE